MNLYSFLYTILANLKGDLPCSFEKIKTEIVDFCTVLFRILRRFNNRIIFKSKEIQPLFPSYQVPIKQHI